jgi:hypothetical protein
MLTRFVKFIFFGIFGMVVAIPGVLWAQDSTQVGPGSKDSSGVRVAKTSDESGSSTGRVIFRGTWGSGLDQIGMRLAAPDMLPQAPFMGPGGFRLDPDGTLWLSDSVQGCVKGFSITSPKAPPRIFLCPFARLGDLAVTSDAIFVVAMEPRGIHILDKTTGHVRKHIPIPLVNPGRIMITDSGGIIIEDPDGGPWLVGTEGAARHPAGALESVGNADVLFGTLYDFEAESRKIIKAGLHGPGDEPDLFTIFRRRGGRIAFSRLVGMVDGNPVLAVLTASAPQTMEMVGFDENGREARQARLPVSGSIFLPSQWIIGPKSMILAFSADLTGFTVTRYDFSDLLNDPKK